MSTATATVRFGANLQGLTTGIGQAKSALTSFAAQASAIASGQALFAGLQASLGLVAQGVRSLANVFETTIKEAGDFESINAQFQTFYRSADTAAGAVAELAKYAATTSFQLSDVASAGAGLAAAGVPADQLKESIRVLGDIAAGARKPLAEILQPYVKTLSTGRLQTEGFLQFLERGIPLGEQLKRSLNLDDAGLQKALSSSAISAQNVVDALQEITKTGLFAGAAAAQGETLNGKISTLKDTLTEILRSLGTAASGGLKPLINLATMLAEELKPVGTALGNLFTTAAQKALDFAFNFRDGFMKAVDFGIKAFQLLEGSIKNGTLWEIVTLSGKLAFSEIQSFALRAFQGLEEVFSGADLIGSLTPIADSFIDRLINAGPQITAALESPLGQAFVRAVDAFGAYLKQQIEYFTVGLLDYALPAFLSPGRADVTGAQMQRAGLGDDGPNYGFAAGNVTPGQAAEIQAAARAGYSTPLSASEVRETFANGRRLTYNTREKIAGSAIIPPRDADIYTAASGVGDFSKLSEAFQTGSNKQTEATKRLEESQRLLREQIKRLADAAIKNATKLDEDTAALKNSTELTAKQTDASGKAGSGGKSGDQFTSLQKIGGGLRTINLTSRETIGLEGKAPGLRGAGDFGGGFANSAAFLAAKKKEAILKLPVEGPPAEEFFKMRGEFLRTPRRDFDVAPPFPMPGGGFMPAGDPAVRAIQEYQQQFIDEYRRMTGEIVGAIKDQGSLEMQAI